eukprot:scaffold8101_cov66-Cylindrotheca_fusiformis.AAC.1
MDMKRPTPPAANANATDSNGVASQGKVDESGHALPNVGSDMIVYLRYDVSSSSNCCGNRSVSIASLESCGRYHNHVHHEVSARTSPRLL